LVLLSRDFLYALSDLLYSLDSLFCSSLDSPLVLHCLLSLFLPIYFIFNDPFHMVSCGPIPWSRGFLYANDTVVLCWPYLLPICCMYLFGFFLMLFFFCLYFSFNFSWRLLSFVLFIFPCLLSFLILSLIYPLISLTFRISLFLNFFLLSFLSSIDFLLFWSWTHFILVVSSFIFQPCI
jgi:hypothetical protein